ncbi:MAG: hypothetical protein Q9222_002801 [Ikaeria aurantiellina]
MDFMQHSKPAERPVEGPQVTHSPAKKRRHRHGPVQPPPARTAQEIYDGKLKALKPNPPGVTIVDFNLTRSLGDLVGYLSFGDTAALGQFLTSPSVSQLHLVVDRVSIPAESFLQTKRPRIWLSTHTGTHYAVYTWSDSDKGAKRATVSSQLVLLYIL